MSDGGVHCPSAEPCEPSPAPPRTAGIHRFGKTEYSDGRTTIDHYCQCGATIWMGDLPKWDQAAYVAFTGGVELGPPSISDVAVNIEDALMCLTPGLNTTADTQLRALLTIARGHLLAALAYAKKEATW